MARRDSLYRTINTVDGVTLHVYDDEKTGTAKPHSVTGPAVIFPKEMNRPDEYHLYGIMYNYSEWLELSRPLRKSVPKEDLAEQ